MSHAERLKWNARYAEQGASREPSRLVEALAGELPRGGRALDIAGGGGRHALWLARRGFDVTLADISETALDLGRRAAADAGLQMRTVAIDFEADPFPVGPWDLLLSFHYLWRPLFDIAPRVLAPGGHLVFIHPTRSNLLRHPKPGPAFLLEDGEIQGLVLAAGLSILRYEEGWSDGGRHEARLVAQRPLDAATSR